MKYTLSVLVENRPGVLTRIAGLFARRGYNIDSLSVGRTEDDRFSRMTIVVDGDSDIVEQVAKQLNKLIDVIKVTDITSVPHVERELVFIQVSSDSGNRGEIMDLLNIFRGRVIDMSKNNMIVESTGDSAKIDAMISSLRPYGIKEVMRTGKIGLLRGTKEDDRRKG
ncbi:MAG: acetolactate synthase small subunit [Fusobacteria bacterium]|nr:acetolactate synthase small subunit [Fusobacteriota bacterium]